MDFTDDLRLRKSSGDKVKFLNDYYYSIRRDRTGRDEAGRDMSRQGIYLLERISHEDK